MLVYNLVCIRDPISFFVYRACANIKVKGHEVTRREHTDTAVVTNQPPVVEDGPVKRTRNVVNDIKRLRLGKVIVGKTPEEYKPELIEQVVFKFFF